LDRRLGGLQNQSGRCGEEKILDPTGTRPLTPRVVQPVASCYTDYAKPSNHSQYNDNQSPEDENGTNA
jgi:hypothetical protein